LQTYEIAVLSVSRHKTRILSVSTDIIASSSAQHYHRHTSRHNMNIILQHDRARNAARRSPTPTTGAGVPGGLKRKSSSTSWAPGSHPPTISRLTDLLATCTKEQFTETIHHLPESWLATNGRGSIVTKRQLEMPQCGAYNDDHSVLLF